jgi:hypothetical protein
MRKGLCIHHLKVSIQRAQQREAEAEHQGRAGQTARVTTTPRPPQTARVTNTPRSRISLCQVLSAKKVAAKAKNQIASAFVEKVQKMQCDIDSLRAMVQTVVKHLDSSAPGRDQVQDIILQSTSSQNDSRKRARECQADPGPHRRRRSSAEGFAIRISAPHPSQAPTSAEGPFALALPARSPPTQRYLPGIGCAMVWEKQGKAVRVKESVWQQARVELE